MNKIAYLKHYNFAGYPMVSAQARFHRPTRFGDEIAIETRVSEFGRSSFKIEHRLMKGDALAVESFETRVWAIRQPGTERLKSHPIPPEVLSRLQA